MPYERDIGVLMSGWHQIRRIVISLGVVSVTSLAAAAGTLFWVLRSPRPASASVLAHDLFSIAAPVALAAVLGAWLVRVVLTDLLKSAIKDLKRAYDKLKYEVNPDPLTGLPNRNSIERVLNEAVTKTSRRPSTSVLVLDLDRMSEVNSSLGHVAGDQIIRQFSQRLRSLLDPGDCLARIDGDEFLICRFSGATRSGLEQLCESVIDAASQPFAIEGDLFYISVSIGVASADRPGCRSSTLMRRARLALHLVKKDGGADYRFFEQTMDQVVQRRIEVEADLRRALNQHEFQLFYQTKVDPRSANIVGLEALIRWIHPTKGLVPPDQFIPVAEESGLIIPIGEVVLRQAFEMSRRLPHLSIAINLSAVQFRYPGFAERVIAIAKEYEIAPEKIELEITETALLDRVRASNALQALRRAGFRIALDDFGTGHSGLEYLRHFNVDKIKIDRSFVHALGDAPDPRAEAILKAIVDLGHAMKLSVTAEGVETNAQWQFLSAIGCDELQGFLFSKPVPHPEGLVMQAA